jgi:CheY-like chemotaxis protein
VRREVLTVLVVDDQREMTVLISDWLRRAGHVPIAAASGREAVALLASMHFDGLVTDLVMPNGNGIELILHARQAHPQLRIVAISGADQSDAGLAAGADACLRKPLQAAELIQLLG